MAETNGLWERVKAYWRPQEPQEVRIPVARPVELERHEKPPDRLRESVEAKQVQKREALRDPIAPAAALEQEQGHSRTRMIGPQARERATPER